VYPPLILVTTALCLERAEFATQYASRFVSQGLCGDIVVKEDLMDQRQRQGAHPLLQPATRCPALRLAAAVGQKVPASEQSFRSIGHYKKTETWSHLLIAFSFPEGSFREPGSRCWNNTVTT